MGMGVHQWEGADTARMKVLLLLAVLVPSLNAICLIQGCDKYWAANKNNREVTGACAVVFDENCCDASNDVYVISKTAKGGKDGEKGKFCGGAFGISNPLSSCKGPGGLKDDITSLMVMPGCKLEVWDHSSGLSNAEAEEKKSPNAGKLRDAKDKYKQNKLEFEATRDPFWVEDIDSDFDDLDNDIESYRCTCG